MAIEVVTKDDLQSFRTELLQDLKQIFSHTIPQKPKQWLKSQEVRKLLKISPGTLQNLRINGTLRFTKIGGLMYYSYEDIELLLESGMNDHSKHQGAIL
ncbi:MAG: helix-turn-helix domain-containing protein [Cyclobacteriaceae bacterium]|nr:helix-turn-helix domain-containing protein [Cyclobacteriaceae bacterium]